MRSTDESGRLFRQNLTQMNVAIAGAAVAIDVLLFALATAGAVWFDALPLEIACGVLAGTAISMMFILGHDAAHNCLFRTRRANAIVGRILFLPCLHNRTLWLLQHNRLHHQDTNVKDRNSFSPFDAREFAALPPWRRQVERVYRSPLGFGVYYLVERWFKHKFFPLAGTPGSFRTRALVDFLLLMLWFAAFAAVVAKASLAAGHPAWQGLVFGVAFPFYVWNHLMGFTAFVQHTHPRARWTRASRAAKSTAWQTDATVMVRFPAWYDVLSHNIMHHPAHHLNPSVPWYRLPAFERELPQSIADRMIVETMSPRYLLQLAARCKLYEYETGQWMTFAAARRAPLATAGATRNAAR